MMQNTLNFVGGSAIAMLIVWVAGHMLGVL
jgi:hypothetical protein